MGEKRENRKEKRGTERRVEKLTLIHMVHLEKSLNRTSSYVNHWLLAVVMTDVHGADSVLS